MAENKQYSKFIWLVAGVILLAVAAYAFFQGQPVKFPFGDKPVDQGFNFMVSHDIGTDTVQSELVLYIDGGRAASLSVDRNRPSATATITLPKPGLYGYRLEETVISDVTSPDMSRTYTGEGKLEINPGDGFRVGRIVTLFGPGLPSATKLTLSRILTKEEQEAEEKRRMEEFDKLFAE